LLYGNQKTDRLFDKGVQKIKEKKVHGSKAEGRHRIECL
jgi:hypothetical protein